MILQINAIIIAGLLILMTIQSTVSISPKELLLEGLVAQKNFDGFNETSSKIAQSFKEKNWELDDRTADFLISESYQSALEVSQLLKRGEIYDELDWWQKITFSASYPANIILIPFAISAMIELVNWVRKRDDNPTVLGVTFCYLGFGIMLAIFLTNFIFPLY